MLEENVVKLPGGVAGVDAGGNARLVRGAADAEGRRSVAVMLGPEGAPAGNVRTLTTGSQQTAAIAAWWVDIIADAACFVELGSNPTATADTSYYVPAGVTYRFPITSGNKIAARTATGTGNLWYHPVQ